MNSELALGDRLDRRTSRLGALIVSMVVSMVVLREQSPLGWDEAVYAARAKDLALTNFDWSTISSGYWSDLRAPGFPAFLGLAFEVAGISDFVARGVVVIFSVGLLAVIAATLDLFNKPRVGTSAIAITIACPGFLATSTLAFADHPGAFFSVLAVYFALRSYTNETSSPLFMVPISLGIATTVRFGAVMFVVAPLGIIGLAVLWRYTRSKDPRQLVSFVAAGATSVVVVGYLLTSQLLTRYASPIGAKQARITEVGNASSNWVHDLKTILAPGPVDYGFNGAFWGWSYAAIFTLLAIMVVVRLLIYRRIVALAMVIAISLTPVLLYGLTVRQFVTTYLAPEFAIGAAMLAWGYWVAVESDRPSRRSASDEATRNRTSSSQGLLIVAVSLVYLIVGSRTFIGVSNMHNRLQGFEQVRVASVLANDLLGEECRLFTTRVPQAAWYSDCKVAGFSSGFVEDDSGRSVDEQLNEYIAKQASRTSITDRVNALGFLILEGVSNQPKIDTVWPNRDPDRSVMLSSPRGRRVALVGMPLP